MCGIAGFLFSQHSAGDARAAGRAMAEAIRHRGPDAAGYWADDERGLVLVHRRLAVVDLSTAGAQPMISPSGRYVTSFNGEIYNHRDLRLALLREGFDGTWRGHSDTETLLTAVDVWGLVDALKRSVGMFALALWDRLEHRLHLARDRMGEKPLYYGWHGRTFLFASELRALEAYPGFKSMVDRESLRDFLDVGYVASPRSILQSVHKLVAGTTLTIDTSNRSVGPAISRYWSLREVACAARMHPYPGTEQEGVQDLERHLNRSVASQSVADVPVGAFLSGGVDSSLVVASMQSQTTRRVQTFTIGFEETRFDEAPIARKVAEHLGTEHHELYVSGSDALSVLPQLAGIYSEPFADASQIPTWLVSRMARHHVTVSLSGDAGDELFGGYDRYFLARDLWLAIQRVPRSLRSLVAHLLHRIPFSVLDRLVRPLQGALPKALRRPLLADDLNKGTRFLGSGSEIELYCMLLRQLEQNEAIVCGISQGGAHAIDSSWPEPDFFAEAMLLDGVEYLSENILTKVDRAAMSVSLETRIPLLDHRLVEFAWSLPTSYKVRGHCGKLPLRTLLRRHLPAALVDRPKMGFSVPVDVWLRGPLRSWANDLLSPELIRRQGFLNATIIEKKWTEHQSGRRNWQFLLWSVLMFQAWLQERTSR
jgi:asparagine synthase (glutamine-hydrolysing)